MEKKYILVTGGAGFIGSHLCERLVSDGHVVLCFDDLSTGCLNNLGTLLSHNSFLFVEGCIVENEIPTGFFDEIYNLACPASPKHYQADPIKTTLINVLGITKLLDSITDEEDKNPRTKRTRILQASTSEVYGDPDVHPQTEEYVGNVNPIGPRSCYDVGKRAAESILFDHHREYGTHIKVARIFNTYGPKMTINDGRVVPNFINAALGSKDLSIYGSGERTRSFCYISDTINGLLKLMRSSVKNIGPYNIGNPDEFTIQELADKVVKHTLSSSDIRHLESVPQDDPKRRCPDISKAKADLDWEPFIKLDTGLASTITHYKKYYS